MQFMLIMNETAAERDKRNDPAVAGDYWGAWTAFVGEIQQAGIVVNGDGLQPPHTATTVRIIDGKRVVQDGPFADTKEQLGGYFTIDVPDRDTALAWAAKSPAASGGSVEVRPIMLPPPNAA